MTSETSSNHLKDETSPYLLQHVSNPVNWYPWGDDAIKLAQEQNKPILLSIGYSACHWCHVMAHESFENDEIAQMMNQLYVNIKVDREERPDLDKIYQTAQQMLTRKTGGWPLTMFLTPDEHIPFFGGTYFPPESRYGMPGFPEVLQRVADFYSSEKEAIAEQNTALMDAFSQMQPESIDADTITLTTEPLLKSIRELTHAFDTEEGGFSNAPKFPSPGNIEKLLHHQEMFQEDADQVHSMISLTLDKMAKGGIYDHVGGGFCRYSVDHMWMIPHFEKMLYDNGPLLNLYSNAWRRYGGDLYKNTAIETANWMIKEMQSPEGAFYSSLDADSEGVEGKFYVWTLEEISQILTKNEYELVTDIHGLNKNTNFEGKWHLCVDTPLPDIATKRGENEQDLRDIYLSAKEKLYQVRARRIWPGRDEKILTSWNALAIKGMATAGLTFNEPRFQTAAEQALTYIHEKHWQDEKLLATSKDGRVHLNAYLDDYAYLIDACLAVLQVKWSNKWLQFATHLAESLLENFEDKEDGGFYFTSNHHEKLIQRRIDFMDDAMPSGNAIAAKGLIRLGHLTGNETFIAVAHRTLKRAWKSIEHFPMAHQAMLQALEDGCAPPVQIILRGHKDEIMKWKLAVYPYLPLRGAVYAISDKESELPETIEIMTAQNGPTAYLCEGFTCQAPITVMDELLNHLKVLQAQ